PRHRPRLNDMTLQQTVIGGCNLSIGSEAANRVVFLRPVSWQQRASTIAQQRVVDVIRVQSAGPVQLPQGCVSLVRSDIEHNFFVTSFETDGQEQFEVQLTSVVLPSGKNNLHARFERSVIGNNRNRLRIRES